MSNVIKCRCGLQMTEDEFRHHYTNCNPFKNQFREVDKSLGDALKAQGSQVENLPLLKFLLKSYISLLDQKISEK